METTPRCGCVSLVPQRTCVRLLFLELRAMLLAKLSWKPLNYHPDHYSKNTVKLRGGKKSLVHSSKDWKDGVLMMPIIVNLPM